MMPVINQKLHCVMSINGQNDSAVGHDTFPDLLKRLIIWARTADTRGFSSLTVRFSVNELKSMVAKHGENDLQAMVIAAIGIDNIPMMSAEDEAAYELVKARNNDDSYQLFIRATSSENFRNNLAVDEWEGIKTHVLTLYPDEYAKHSHMFE